MRERSLLAHVLAASNEGNPDSVLSAMDEFWDTYFNQEGTAEWKLRGDKIDEAVKDFVQKFKDDGFHLPLAYAEGFGYMLSGKKVHLACFGKKLHIRFGGGYIEFRDYLDQKKIVLHELARRKDNCVFR